MTGPRRRKTDRPGFLATVWKIYDAWGAIIQLAIGVGLFVVSVVVLVLAMQVYQQSSNAERLSGIACERSKTLGPLNFEEHRRLGVYSPEDLKYFRDTIPQDCE